MLNEQTVREILNENSGDDVNSNWVFNRNDIEKVTKEIVRQSNSDRASVRQGDLQPCWVAVSEKLPNYEEPILLICKYFGEASWGAGSRKTGYLESIGKNGGNFRVSGDTRKYNEKNLQKVTHWMPLPSKPTA